MPDKPQESDENEEEEAGGVFFTTVTTLVKLVASMFWAVIKIIGILIGILMVSYWVIGGGINLYNESRTKTSKEAVDAYSQGLIHLRAGQFYRAVDSFTIITEMHSFIDKSQKAEAYLGRGRAHAGLGNYDLAIKDYDKVIQMRPEKNIEQRAYFYRGIAVKNWSP